MIYTITFNPSIDYMVNVDHFKLGEVNRTSNEYILPGGKGINVSIVLHNIGIESEALGFIAGFTGKEIERLTKTYGITTSFIDVKNGYSRINFKMKSDEESEVNGNGPQIYQEHLDLLMEKLSYLTQDDILVLSGSIPNSVPTDIYSYIMEKLSHKNIKVVVDATGDLLMNVLKHRPFVIKPNNHELEEMFHVKLSTLEDIIFYAKKLLNLGARNVLISMAGDGALLICENGKTYQCNAPKGIIKNSVGAGDSMVAGFIAGYVQSSNYEEAFKMGVATGSASAFSKNLATKKEIDSLLQDIEIKNID